LYREGLARALQGGEEISVAGQASSPEEALEALVSLHPDVVLVDMAMRDALYTAEQILRIAPSAKVIALTVSETERDIIACAEAGVAGYVTRDGTFQNVIQSIQAVTKGEFQCSAHMAGVLLRRVATRSDRRNSNGSIGQLTGRESLVLELVNEGFSNKEIARQLDIEVATVKNHIHNVLEKLRVHRRGEAAALLRRARRDQP